MYQTSVKHFSYFKTLLAGHFYLGQWKSFADVKKSIDNWMDYYNKDRCQWQLAKLSPDEFFHCVSTGVYPLLAVRSAVTEGGSAP